MDNIYKGRMVKELIESDFKVEEKRGKYTVKLNRKLTDGLNGILIIYAPWCEHCMLSKPMWENIARLFQYKFRVYALNTYNFRGGNQNMTLPLDVHVYPDYKFVDRKGDVLEYDGGKSEADFTKFIVKNI